LQCGSKLSKSFIVKSWKIRLRVVDCNAILKGKGWSIAPEIILWQNTSMHDLFATGK
jgi:hypothetical protein